MLLRICDVSKMYERHGQRVVAFQASLLEIAKGDYVALVGPSGSGKTTLLSLLGGMLSPTSGEVWFGEQSVYRLSLADRTELRRRTIGFVFQTFNLIPYLSALENVQVPLVLAGVSSSQQQKRAAELLERVGLADRMQHKPRELSTGQQQRVALARTLANDPALILADEPTGNLDPDSRQRVLDFFDEFHREGRTIVMVTHDAVAASRAARRLCLRDGTVCAEHEAPRNAA